MTQSVSSKKKKVCVQHLTSVSPTGPWSLAEAGASLSCSRVAGTEPLLRACVQVGQEGFLEDWDPRDGLGLDGRESQELL